MIIEVLVNILLNIIAIFFYEHRIIDYSKYCLCTLSIIVNVLHTYVISILFSLDSSPSTISVGHLCAHVLHNPNKYRRSLEDLIYTHQSPLYPSVPPYTTFFRPTSSFSPLFLIYAYASSIFLKLPLIDSIYFLERYPLLNPFYHLFIHSYAVPYFYIIFASHSTRSSESSDSHHCYILF